MYFFVYYKLSRKLNGIATLIIFAIIGALVNLIAAFVTKEGDSINQKAVNLHMLDDVLGWIVVLIGAIMIKITNHIVRIAFADFNGIAFTKTIFIATF